MPERICAAAGAMHERYVAASAVMTTEAGEEYTTNQQDQDERDNPGYFHPAWCAVGGQVSHVCVLFSARYHKDSVRRCG
jgi:hypothetical protein